MKANELMIGDWVKVTDDDTEDSFIGQVKAIDELENINVQEGEDVAYPYSIDCLEPIPLTPEILEKNGFKQGKEGFEKRYFTLEIDGNEISIYMGELCKEIHIRRGCFPKVNNISVANIHELQHALRLCGIEKEITI